MLWSLELEIESKMKTKIISQLRFVLLLLTWIRPSSSVNRIFYWEGPHLVQGSEENLEYRDIPVIEGELLVVTCWVKATDPDSEYMMTIYDDYTNSNTSGLLEDKVNGLRYVKEIINVNIDSSAAIDEKVILCELNKPTEETIKLTFKAFVIDRISVPDQVCQDCDGKVKLTLRRPKFQKKEAEDLEEELKLKLKEKFGILDTDIGINSTNGIVTAEVDFVSVLSLSGPFWRVEGRPVEDILHTCTSCASTTTPDIAPSSWVEVIVGGTVAGLVALCVVVVGVWRYMKRKGVNDDDSNLNLENLDNETEKLN